MITYRKARALARAPLTAIPKGAAAGAAIAVALGGAYLAGGLAQDAATRGQAARFSQLAKQGFSDEAMDRAVGGDVSTATLARRYEDAGMAAQAAAQSGPTATVNIAPALAALRGPAALAAGPLSQARELECLTQAVYYEARGETPAGQAAVAQVVLNRVKSPAFPKSVCGVVFQGAGGRGCQFSFACNGAMNGSRERSAWDRARRVAARAISGQLVAGIGSATHFHVTSVSPDWNGMIQVAQVGSHIFYRFGPPGAHRVPQAEVIEAVAEAEAAPEPAPQVILASVTVPVPPPVATKPESTAPVAATPKPEALKARPEATKAEPAKPLEAAANKPAKAPEAASAKSAAL